MNSAAMDFNALSRRARSNLTIRYLEWEKNGQTDIFHIIRPGPMRAGANERARLPTTVGRPLVGGEAASTSQGAGARDT
jgi:hypothetical protein